MATNIGSGNNYGKFFVIPQVPEDFRILQAVDRKTRYEMNSVYGCNIDYDWQCNTIANSMVETIISQLASLIKRHRNEGLGINFYDIFVAEVSMKINERAEKEGNINILFHAGPNATDIIKNGLPTQERRSTVEDFTTGDEMEDKFNDELDKHARYMLNLVHGITFVTNGDHGKFIVTATCAQFMKNLFAEMLIELTKLVEETPEAMEHLVTVNFNDNIEIHAYHKDDNIGFSLRPGMNAKLSIKSDESTEDTNEDMLD